MAVRDRMLQAASCISWIVIEVGFLGYLLWRFEFWVYLYCRYRLRGLNGVEWERAVRIRLP